MASDDSDADWLIEEDIPQGQADAAQAAPPWRVLIVDDDVDVHVVTKFSLSNTSFLGRRLSFLHAYSGAEALTVLRNTPDVAVVLLDVIMETNDAGLQVARRIRDELDNRLVRIVLRTGQPGQALEHSIILDYDINDFWCKTDLTTRKLFTTVISSLRTYSSLIKAEQRSASLCAALDKARQLEAALERHALVLKLNRQGKIVAANGALCTLLRYARDGLTGQTLGVIAPADAAPLAALAGGSGWSGELTALDADGGAHCLRAMIVPLDKEGEAASHFYAILAAA